MGNPPWKIQQDDPLTRAVIGCAIEVHKQLGPGLLEGVYEECLCHELASQGLAFQRQVQLPIVYKGIALNSIYRIDLLVADELIVEIKAIEQLLPVHEDQLLTYLRLTKKRTGLLINFNVPLLARGVKRMKL
jgi:GxxExxY protein